MFLRLRKVRRGSRRRTYSVDHPNACQRLAVQFAIDALEYFESGDMARFYGCIRSAQSFAEKADAARYAPTEVEEPEEAPECDAGCGKELSDDDAHRLRRNGTWTCPACEAEAEAERLADARNDR